MHRRLLLVTVDRLPAWMLPAWGATWVSTPAIDSLAGRGLVCDRAVATSVDPRDTLAELAAGLLAAAAAAGLVPRLVTDDVRLPAWLAVGDEVAKVVPVVVPRRPARRAEETNLGRLFTAARECLAAAHGLVWIHAGSLGAAWDAPESFREPYVDADDPPTPTGGAAPSVRIDADTDPDLVVGYRQAFAAQLTLLDRFLGELIAGLPSDPGEEKAWAICLVGLRGMPLGLHGWIGAPEDPMAERPYGETLHVPTLLVDPAARMAGQRYPGLVTPADVGATLRDWLGLPPAEAVGRTDARSGRSLEDLFAAWQHPERDRVIGVAPGGVAVVTPSWQLVEEIDPAGPTRPRLYAKPDDYFELCDVADRCPDELAALQRVAEAARRGPPGKAWETPLGLPAGEAG
jgi:hypothetical protein